MRIKNTMRYHFIFIRITITKKEKKKKNTSVGKNVEKLEPLCIAGRNSMCKGTKT